MTPRPDRALLLLDRLPDASSANPGERRVHDLVSDVAHGLGALAVWCPGWPEHGGLAEELEAAGAELLVDVIDVASWIERHAFEFSLVITHGFSLAARLRRVIEHAQPQARHLLSIDTPLSWSVEAMACTVDPLEEPGLEALLRRVRAIETSLWRSAHAVLVDSEQARARLAREAPFATVVAYPHCPAVDERPPPLSERSGLACIGAFSSEFGAPDADGVQWFIDEVLPQCSTPPHPLTICGEDLTPWMRDLRSPALDVAGPEQLSSHLRRSRVCAFPRWYGASTKLAVLDAMAAGTPFVTTPLVARSFDLGDLEPRLVARDPSVFASLVESLMVDDERWNDAHRGLRSLAAEQLAPPARRRMLESLIAQCGIVASREGVARLALRREDQAPPTSRGTLAVYDAALASFERELLDSVGMELDRDTAIRLQVAVSPQDRYALWRRVHEPGAHTLDGMRHQARRLAHQPLVSIVMPVYNAEPSHLRAAIDSVLDQVYERWELCIADDASSSAATRAVLDHYEQLDPRIRVRWLEENQGIAGASNAALQLAGGELVGLLDHDDLLKPDALFWVVKLLNARPDLDVIYSDEDKVDEHGTLKAPFFKPDWSPDLLLSVNYVAHFLVLRRSLLDAIGGFRTGLDGSQDFDLVLRATERTDRIAHIAKPLYTWRIHEESTAWAESAKPYAGVAGRKALRDALARRGIEAEVRSGTAPTFYRVRYRLLGTPRICVVIPTRDRVDLLARCVEAARARTAYKNLEFMIVDNESRDPETLSYLDDFDGRVVRYPHRFNYARMMNLAALEAEADYLILLNNDAEARTDGWVERLLEQAQRPEVGVVGARLFFPDGRSQHEGIVLGVGGVAYNLDAGDYFGFGTQVRNCAAVTGACMMTRTSVFWEVGGFEERLRVAYNDVDYCLRVGERGYRVIYTPEVELVHPESSSRKSLHPDEDESYFQRRWGPPRAIRDPFHNPNLDLLNPLVLRV